MTNYVTLLGAEQVAAAGSAIRDAAESMRQTASNLDQSLHYHRQLFEDLLLRAEHALTKRVVVMKNIAVPSDNPLRSPEFKLVEDHTGEFQTWGTAFEELRDGPVQYTTAVVKMADGSIKVVPAEYVRFL
jgi:hypothetical protein